MDANFFGNLQDPVEDVAPLNMAFLLQGSRFPDDVSKIFYAAYQEAHSREPWNRNISPLYSKNLVVYLIEGAMIVCVGANSSLPYVAISF